MDKHLKLLLVVPNFRWNAQDARVMWHITPYNLCLLAAMVEDLCPVSILDAYALDLTPEDFQARIAKEQPDLVGISVMMDQCAPAGHRAAALVKAVDPQVQVHLGGVYPTVSPEQAMEDANLDMVIIGEGEYVLRELVQHYLFGAALPEQGICYRENGQLVNRGRAPLIDDPGELPLPAYKYIDFTGYSNSAARKSVDSPPEFPYARVLTSRGCPQKCNFCQVDRISGRKFRARSAENVLKEIAWLKDEYGIRSLIFDDDNLFANKNRAMAIFQGMIDQGLALPWKAISTAVFHLDAELLTLMAQSGCQYIDVAIESGTERVLKEVIQKPVSLDYAKQMVKIARELGIYVAANFIVGFPTETWDEIRRTIAFAEELAADYVKIFNAIPLRHTRLWEQCEETGAFKEGFDVDQVTWFAGQIETEHFTPDDLTVLRAFEWERINFSTLEKQQKTAAIMKISVDELYQIRRDTLKSAITQLRASGK